VVILQKFAIVKLKDNLMKRKLLFLLCSTILLSGVFFLSCKKTADTIASASFISPGSAVSEYLIKKELPKDGLISMINNNMGYGRGDQENLGIQIGAFFYETKGSSKFVYPGNLLIDGLSLPFYQDGMGFSLYSGNFYSSHNDTLSRMAAMWGKRCVTKLISSDNATVSYVTTSNGIVSNKPTGIDSGFYVPAKIVMTSNGVANQYIAKDKDNVVSWIPDTNNPSGIVLLGIVRWDTRPGGKGETIYFKEIPDNGYCVVTPDMMQKLTSGLEGEIFIARGNYTKYTDPVTKKEIFIEAVTSSITGPVKVF
jgi:hypothetical protein